METAILYSFWFVCGGLLLWVLGDCAFKSWNGVKELMSETRCVRSAMASEYDHDLVTIAIDQNEPSVPTAFQNPRPQPQALPIDAIRDLVA